MLCEFDYIAESFQIYTDKPDNDINVLLYLTSRARPYFFPFANFFWYNYIDFPNMTIKIKLAADKDMRIFGLNCIHQTPDGPSIVSFTAKSNSNWLGH